MSNTPLPQNKTTTITTNKMTAAPEGKGTTSAGVGGKGTPTKTLESDGGDDGHPVPTSSPAPPRSTLEPSPSAILPRGSGGSDHITEDPRQSTLRRRSQRRSERRSMRINSNSTNGSSLLIDDSMGSVFGNKGDSNINNNHQQDPASTPALSPMHRQFRRGGGSRGSQVFLPRIVNRDMAFHQSSNRFSVKTVYQRVFWSVVWLTRHDLFHILMRLRFITAFFILISIWTVMILFFGGVYMIVGTNNVGFSNACLLGAPHPETGEPTTLTFAAAFAFSLETCTTVGYGLPNGANSFFEAGCTNLQIAIYFQMVWSMLFNAFMFSFLFSQLSKSETRAIQLIYSDKLCITATVPPSVGRSKGRHRHDSAHFLDDHGPITLAVRCYDLDAEFPLVECHARMYLLDHQKKLHPLRLQDPNDELGAVLLPSIPTELVHVIDHHSVLSPTRTMPLVDNESLNAMPMRSIDSVIGSREEIICPVCGESYGTYERLKRHVVYSAQVDDDAGFDFYPVSHRGFKMPDIRPVGLEQVKRHIERTLSEIIVVVEAIDPQLSGTFQSLQSYKYDDITFGSGFHRCLYVSQNQFVVDMKKFHKIEYDPEWKHLWSTEPLESMELDDASTLPPSMRQPTSGRAATHDAANMHSSNDDSKISEEDNSNKIKEGNAENESEVESKKENEPVSRDIETAQPSESLR